MANPYLKSNPKYTSVNSILLAQYAFKIMTYMNDLNQSLLKCNALIKAHKAMPNIFDAEAIDQAGVALAERHQEAIKEFNEMNVELEYRIKKDVGFEFKYYEMEKHAKAIDKAFGQYQAEMVNRQNQGGGGQRPGPHLHSPN